MTTPQPGGIRGSFSLSFSYPNEEWLVGLVRNATTAITYIGPGLTLRLAEAIRDQIEQKPSILVKVTLDLDPEVCRLGFGDLKAIEQLENLPGGEGVICRRAGLRLCAFTVDGTTLVFPPVPRLVESPTQAATEVPPPINVALDKPSEVCDRVLDVIAPDAAAREDVHELKKDLQNNPPLPFDLSQRVRVFNAQFEFVEFELKGLALSRKKVPLPSFLMGLSRDPKTQNLLQSSFRLIGDDTELSSDVVLKLKKSLIDRYLITLPNYGAVILRANKPRFERSIRLLKHFIARYQRKVEKLLEIEMRKNQETVGRMLFPLVRQNVPSDWKKYFSGPPSEADVRELLAEELGRAFGRPSDHFQKMSCSVIFKGITYELLNDEQFIETARKHIKSQVRLYVEYDAAKVRA